MDFREAVARFQEMFNKDKYNPDLKIGVLMSEGDLGSKIKEALRTYNAGTSLYEAASQFKNLMEARRVQTLNNTSAGANYSQKLKQLEGDNVTQLLDSLLNDMKLYQSPGAVNVILLSQTPLTASLAARSQLQLFLVQVFPITVIESPEQMYRRAIYSLKFA